MSGDAGCWRSECRTGCYYPDVCSEKATRPEGKHLTDCPSCGVTFGVSAKHMVRQRARCLACIRKAGGWTCQTCGSTDPHHPFPCPTPHEGANR